MDRLPPVGKHSSGPARPLLSIRLTRNDPSSRMSPNQRAQALLDLALAGTNPERPEEDGQEFTRFLATLPPGGARPDAPGLVYQHYELLVDPAGEPCVLGRGAMGITYKARDTSLRCEVALKVIHPRYLSDPAARTRFLREARIAAGLRHPNIASIFHLGCRGDEAFYAMEYIAGETLADHVKRLGPFSPAAALDIAAQVTLALAAAHGQGFLHRDIKPANLMLVTGTEGQRSAPVIKVIDFGLVKGIAEPDDVGDRSLAGTYFVGTPVYASPEQLAHRSLDPRTDLYSLGATLSYLLTGSTADAKTRRQGARGKLPPPVEALLDHLLQPDAAARPQDAAEALCLIRRCQAELERSRAILPGKTRRGQLTRGGGRRLFYGLLALLVAVALAKSVRPTPGKVLQPEIVAVRPLASRGGDPVWAATLTEDLRRALDKPRVLETVEVAPGEWQDQPSQAPPVSPLPRWVRWLFTGSVQNQGDLVKIEVRLADARSGRVVWSDVASYSLRVSDLEAIRTDARRRIIANLTAGTFRGSKHFATGQAVPAEASTELARAEIYYQAVTQQANQRAIECCQRALALAPNLARVHALLARAYCQRHVQYGDLPGWLPLAQASVTRALRLDPTLAEGHNALGYNRRGFGQTVGGARGEPPDNRRRTRVRAGGARVRHHVARSGPSRARHSLVESRQYHGAWQPGLRLLPGHRLRRPLRG